MIGVIFYEQDVERTVYNDLTVWKNVIDAWNIDKYVVIDETADNRWLNWNDIDKQFKRVRNMADALAEFSGYSRVYFVEGQGTDLTSFIHPVGDTVYIFGRDTGGFDSAPPVNQSVQITGLVGSLWAVYCLNIVMYVRST